MSVFIGTSGFDYPEWKNIFYPPEVLRKVFLEYYSTVFNALELNFSFYNMPRNEQLLKFYEKSGGRLNFSIKANRQLTHEIGREWKDTAEQYKKAVSVLQEKNVLGAVLFQFPQSFHYIHENRIYLSKLIESFAGFPVVIEFRHAEWIRQSVMEGMAERGVAVALCDMPDFKNLPAAFSDKENTEVLKSAGPFYGEEMYIRLHGRNSKAWYCSDSSANGSSRYVYDYSPEELKAFIPIIMEADAKGKKVHVFFNNHPDGSGAENAKTLKELLQKQ